MSSGPFRGVYCVEMRINLSTKFGKQHPTTQPSSTTHISHPFTNANALRQMEASRSIASSVSR